MTGCNYAEARLLIIDDDAAAIDVAQETLRCAGFRTIEVSSDPFAAVALCAQHEPDVLLLDLQIPQRDGFGVMEAVKQSDIPIKPAIIMLTGDDQADVRIRAYELGAHDHVTKPFIARELVARVTNAAQSVQLTRRLEAAVAARTSRLEDAMAVLRYAEGQLRKQLERSEAQSQSSHKLLMETVHELRTPLNSVLGYSDILRKELFGPLGETRYVEYARLIHESGTHLLKLVDNFLDATRSESGEDRLRIQDVDFGAVVSQTANLLKTDASSSGVTLDVRISPELTTIRTDPTKLRQVILNLGSNAVKYTPRGGRVMIEAKPDIAGGAMVIIVRDTGTGIAPNHFDLVMRPFGRTPDAQQSGIKGTGLGFPLTRRYVEMLGGTLELASELGRGTTVTVRLPATMDKAAA